MKISIVKVEGVRELRIVGYIHESVEKLGDGSLYALNQLAQAVRIFCSAIKTDKPVEVFSIRSDSKISMFDRFCLAKFPSDFPKDVKDQLEYVFNCDNVYTEAPSKVHYLIGEIWETICNLEEGSSDELTRKSIQALEQSLRARLEAIWPKNRPMPEFLLPNLNSDKNKDLRRVASCRQPPCDSNGSSSTSTIDRTMSSPPVAFAPLPRSPSSFCLDEDAKKFNPHAPNRAAPPPPFAAVPPPPSTSTPLDTDDDIPAIVVRATSLFSSQLPPPTTVTMFVDQKPKNEGDSNPPSRICNLL